jgi:hypothetical protein
MTMQTTLAQHTRAVATVNATADSGGETSLYQGQPQLCVAEL